MIMIASTTATSTANTRHWTAPQEATIHSNPSAFLALSSNDKNDLDHNTIIEIGNSSQVIKDRDVLMVGRQASSCDIRIAHKSLSRQHALLYYSTSNSADRLGLYVIDLNTKTGTFINEIKITPNTPAQLKNGDTIQFGKARPTFTIRWENSNNNKKKNGNDKMATTATATATATSNNSNENDNIYNDKDQNDSDKHSVEQSTGFGLTGRDQRKAEIEAMMASLEEKPSYTKYVPSSDEKQTMLNNSQKKDHSSRHQKHVPPNNLILEKYKLPLTACTDIAYVESCHISSVVMDPTGSRFAIGSMNSSLKLYDFGGYNIADPNPFFNGTVEDGYPIRSMSYSSDGALILIGTGSSQCQVFNRDGQDIIKFVRGDVYVRDPSKTIGHTATVTGVGWHPLEKSIVFTTSRDGSLRMWNVDKGKLTFGFLNCSDVVVIKHLRTGRKTIPTCLAVSTNTIAIGTDCGGIQVYKYPFVSKLRPQQYTEVSSSTQQDSNSNSGNSIICLAYSVDATKLACRTKAGVTVWNTASKITTSTPPWMQFDNVPLDDVDTDSCIPTLAFSPNGKILCIATSKKNQHQTRSFRNSLEIFLISKDAHCNKMKPPSPIYSLPFLHTEAGYPVLSLSWHNKLNQILVTTSKGFQIWYSADWSTKGILLTSTRRRKRNKAEDTLQAIYIKRAPPPGSIVREEEIITPNSLPLFSDDRQRFRSKKHRREDEHQESVAKHIPESKPSKGIFRTTTASTAFKQRIMDDNSSTQKIIAGKDPREALAKYNEGKSYIGQAYEGNIERILTTKTVEQEEDEMNNRNRKK